MGRLTIALTLLSIACEPETTHKPVGGQECYELFISARQACDSQRDDPAAWEECLAGVMEPASEDAAELADVAVAFCVNRSTIAYSCTACQQAQAQCFGRRSPLVCS